jgi:hypothetical protein
LGWIPYKTRMAATRAPILLFGSYGELDLFASVDEAERVIDPHALDDGQLACADATGQIYRVLEVGRSIRITETGSTEPEVVRARLAARLREEGELDRLVERAIERFGYRR